MKDPVVGLTPVPITLQGTRIMSGVANGRAHRVSVDFANVEGKLEYQMPQVKGIEPTNYRWTFPMSDASGEIQLLVQMCQDSQQARSDGSLSQCTLLRPDATTVVGKIIKRSLATSEYLDADGSLVCGQPL